MSDPLRPPALRPSDRVLVVAPSGPFEGERLEAGLRKLDRFQVEVPKGLAQRRQGFFAGSDRERLTELQQALDRPDVAAVLIARGGYGIGRIVDQLELSGLLSHPKWVCGFSDTTALHHRLYGEGFLSLHGPNGTTLADTTEDDLSRLLDLLSGNPGEPLSDLEVVCPGSAEGPLLGGNLTVLFCEAAAGRLKFPDGAILFLEDVTETSYRIDRMLSSLRRGGHLEHLSGVVLGEFTDCSAGKFSVPNQDVLWEACLELGVPCVAGFPAGHGSRQLAFIHGQRCQLTDGRLLFAPPGPG